MNFLNACRLLVDCGFELRFAEIPAVGETFCMRISIDQRNGPSCSWGFGGVELNFARDAEAMVVDRLIENALRVYRAWYVEDVERSNSKLFELETRLHAERAHPEFDYATTSDKPSLTGDITATDMLADGCELNQIGGDPRTATWRDEFADVTFTGWRRRKKTCPPLGSQK
jgi:hypothetical protein